MPQNAGKRAASVTALHGKLSGGRKSKRRKRR